ncbi:MAG: hypothetical protein WDN75_10815 [Bacteroidota bacterium]
MSLRASFSKKTFMFSFRARTSRGAMSHKDSWFLKVWDTHQPEVIGIGEAGPLPGLSSEKPEDVEEQLTRLVTLISKGPGIDQLRSMEAIQEFIKTASLPSSLIFALETALLDLKNNGTRTIFQNSFLKGQSIPINGLVWMGGLDFMLSQVSIK